MISSRKHFDFKGKCILEKLTIEKSTRISIDFPTEACYLFVREGRIVVNGVNLAAPLTSNEAVGLNCGYYIADFVNASPHDITEVLAIHLHADILREIFRNELPAFVKADVVPILPSKIIINSILEKFIESLTFYFDNPDIVTGDILVIFAKKKIERAKELLLTSDFSISEIADQVGYKDVSHFSKSFQSLTGTSRTSFRFDFKVN